MRTFVIVALLLIYAFADPARQNYVRTYTAHVVVKSTVEPDSYMNIYAHKEKKVIRWDSPSKGGLWNIADFNTNITHSFGYINSTVHCYVFKDTENVFENDGLGDMKYQGLKAESGHIVNSWTAEQKYADLELTEDAFTGLPVKLLRNETVTKTFSILEFKTVDTNAPDASYFNIPDELKKLCKTMPVNRIFGPLARWF
jgi:hypothetical protein